MPIDKHLKNKLKSLTLALVLALTLMASGHAAPLETPFFTWEVPDGWTVSRDPSGLWQLTAPGSSPLVVAITAARLRTPPQAYLNGSARLWASLGKLEAIEPLIHKVNNQAWFLISLPPQPSSNDSIKATGDRSTIKWVRWRDSLLVVSSFSMPTEDLKAFRPIIQRLASGLKLTRPKFNEARLLQEIKKTLEVNQETSAGLRGLEDIRQQMNIARQDWEPFFLDKEPPIYAAYLSYLEARFDAAFAIVNAKELGIDADTIKSRLKSVVSKREALRHQLQGY